MVGFGFNTASASAPNVSATFEELALPLFGSLYNFAHWLTQNREEAEDLVQETYAKALKGFGSFQPGTNFRAWIFRILRNTFLTSRTGLATTRTVPLDGEDDQPAAVSRETPESVLLEQADQQQVQAALEQVPVSFREVLLLCEVERDELPRDRRYARGTRRHGDVAALSFAKSAARGIGRNVGGKACLTIPGSPSSTGTWIASFPPRRCAAWMRTCASAPPAPAMPCTGCSSSAPPATDALFTGSLHHCNKQCRNTGGPGGSRRELGVRKKQVLLVLRERRNPTAQSSV